MKAWITMIAFLRAPGGFVRNSRNRIFFSVRSAPKPARAGSPDKMLQDTADAILCRAAARALDYVFQSGQEPGAEALLEAARRGMYNVDDACRKFSHRRGLGALFTLPPTNQGKFGARHRHTLALLKSMRCVPEVIPNWWHLPIRMDGKLASLTNHIVARA